MPNTTATANTSACAASSHPLLVIRTTANTTVVMSAPKRGPLGSISICGVPSGDSRGSRPAAWRLGGGAGAEGGTARPVSAG